MRINKQKRETIMKQIILSWLPTEESDEHYPNKHAILLTVGETGYHMTEWSLDRETIIKRNKVQGFTEQDRKDAGNFACFGYHFKSKKTKKETKCTH